MIDFAKEAKDLKQALAENAYPAADGSADIDNHALPIIEVTLRDIAGRRDSEIDRLRAALEPFAKVGRDLVRVGAVVIPDGASAKYLRMDGIEARHFRAVAMALADEQTTTEK